MMISQFSPILVVLSEEQYWRSAKMKSNLSHHSDVRSDTRFMLLPSLFSAEIAPQENGVKALNSRHSSAGNQRFGSVLPAVWLN
ncbi:hypothetical protein [Klebsiella oxytoca]|uniref:Uncharacterized protein n=1 Tax=Klebsiella oxytoca TaxID=571 RepID=A0A6B8MVC2_KLEOX|nr:hypothetical protein [Klebsiella oxytoca]QGN38293.1 hypothetical protein GJ746_13725 [Klebsiella oxytoca]